MRASKTPMTKRESKSQTTWTDVKARLIAFDRPGLLDLLHDLYAAHKDNQAFFHADAEIAGHGFDDVLSLKRSGSREQIADQRAFGGGTSGDSDGSKSGVNIDDCQTGELRSP